MFVANGYQILYMTKLEKILMAVLIVAIAGSIVFWRDLSTLFHNDKEVTVDDVKQEKGGKDKKKKKDKKDNEDDEAYHIAPSGILFYRA